jgi:hypothetical protein
MEISSSKVPDEEEEEEDEDEDEEDEERENATFLRRREKFPLEVQ